MCFLGNYCLVLYKTHLSKWKKKIKKKIFAYSMVLDAWKNPFKFRVRKQPSPPLQLITARSELQQRGPASTGLCCPSNFIPHFVMNHCYEIIIVHFHISVFLLTQDFGSWESLLLDGWNKLRLGGGKLCWRSLLAIVIWANAVKQHSSCLTWIWEKD